jgi:hypothetical protein
MTMLVLAAAIGVLDVALGVTWWGLRRSVRKLRMEKTLRELEDALRKTRAAP